METMVQVAWGRGQALHLEDTALAKSGLKVTQSFLILALQSSNLFVRLEGTYQDFGCGRCQNGTSSSRLSNSFCCFFNCLVPSVPFTVFVRICPFILRLQHLECSSHYFHHCVARLQQSECTMCKKQRVSCCLIIGVTFTKFRPTYISDRSPGPSFSSFFCRRSSDAW